MPLALLHCTTCTVPYQPHNRDTAGSALTGEYMEAAGLNVCTSFIILKSFDVPHADNACMLLCLQRPECHQEGEMVEDPLYGGDYILCAHVIASQLSMSHQSTLHQNSKAHEHQDCRCAGVAELARSGHVTANFIKLPRIACLCRYARRPWPHAHNSVDSLPLYCLLCPAFQFTFGFIPSSNGALKYVCTLSRCYAAACCSSLTFLTMS